MSHLQQTNRFVVLDRDNMNMLQNEAQLAGTAQTLSGARYLITGDVTEFGRKNIGDKQYFGTLGKGKLHTPKLPLILSMSPRQN